MKYYKVRPEYDNKRRNDNNIYIANELYTEKEVKNYHINKNYCDIINVSKNETYFFSGARFA